MSINKQSIIIVKLVGIFIFTIFGIETFAQTIDYFPIGVYAGGRNDPSNNGSTLFTQLDDCGFNIVRVVPYNSGNNSAADFLVQANLKGIDIVLKYTPTNHPAKISAAQKKRYEAEMVTPWDEGNDPFRKNYYYFNHSVGEAYEEFAQNINGWSANVNDQAGLIFYGVYDMNIGYKFPNQYGVTGEWDIRNETDYLVTYRMKMGNIFPGRGVPDYDLARITIEGYKNDSTKICSTYTTLTIGDFENAGADGNYADFTFPYTLPADEGINIVHHNLYWYHSAKLYVDYVEAMDSFGKQMMENPLLVKELIAYEIYPLSEQTLTELISTLTISEPTVRSQTRVYHFVLNCVNEFNSNSPHISKKADALFAHMDIEAHR